MDLSITVLALSLMLSTVQSNHSPSHWNPAGNTRPIIGIVSIDSKVKHGHTYIPATYVKYLEQAGARVVPVRGGQTEEYYSRIVNVTNGILFPGGAVNFDKSLYGKSVGHIFRHAVKINDAGDFYPLWGTCMGFQIMCYQVQGSNLLKPTDSDNISWPLDLSPGYEKSRMLQSASKNIVEYLSHEPVTQNQHHYSIWQEVFQSSKLRDFFNVLSTNKDRKGKTFISTVEAKRYPFYGVQWHPEKNNFNWNPHYVINHDAHAVEVSQYMANFFLAQARKSGHRFPAVAMEARELIHNYDHVYLDDGTFSEGFFIPI